MHERPLKGMLQILQVSLFFVGGIVIIGLIVGRSPLHLLAGLGASAAILDADLQGLDPRVRIGHHAFGQ